jgi:GntR family transcriptional regulator, transcriptional repressor for pyruvate dehydrogenase complex
MFKTIKSKKKFEEVLDQIKYLLLTKKLKFGQKLPNEIGLSESMGISRSSLREAYKVLSVLGIIEGRAGEGTIIKKASPSDLKSILSLIAVSRGLDTKELFEVRSIIEAAAAKLAATRRTSSDLEEIKGILLSIDEQYLHGNEDAEAYGDFLFHQAIVKASKNGMLVMFMEVIADLLGEQIKTTRRELSTSSEVIQRFQEQHWELYHAIESGQDEKVKQLIEDHFIYAQQQLKLTV